MSAHTPAAPGSRLIMIHLALRLAYYNSLGVYDSTHIE